jgi:hypothetical protein
MGEENRARSFEAERKNVSLKRAGLGMMKIVQYDLSHYLSSAGSETH